MRDRKNIHGELPALLAVLATLVVSSNLAADSEAGANHEARARWLEARLMAPCCFMQTIDQHESEAARDMRVEVRQLLAQGLSERQILDRYVERYGARILAVPPAKGFNRLLYSIPSVVTFFLFIGVCLALWKWYRRGRSGGAAV